MLAVRNDHLTVWVLTDVASVLLQLENDLSKSFFTRRVALVLSHKYHHHCRWHMKKNLTRSPVCEQNSYSSDDFKACKWAVICPRWSG